MKLMTIIKEHIQKIRLGHNYSSESFITYLREQGVTVGEGTTFYVPQTNVVDVSRPYMIWIGNYVRVTAGVKILTHGYDWSVIKRKEGVIYGSAGHVIIGDNVFIGMNSIITKGTTIGDNVIIGAGSVVTKDCLEPGVYAGNPARKLMSLDAYIEKKQKRMFSEAVDLAESYYQRYHEMPPKDAFDEFLFLWEDDLATLPQKFQNQLDTSDNRAVTEQAYAEYTKAYPSYKAFVEAIKDVLGIGVGMAR